MKLLFDESLSPRLVSVLRDLFPESESALRNGLARTGDQKILQYAAAHDFILVACRIDFVSIEPAGRPAADRRSAPQHANVSAATGH